VPMGAIRRCAPSRVWRSSISAPLWMRCGLGLQISRIRLSDKTSRLFACNAVCTQRPLGPYVEERLERMRRLRITARLDAPQLSLQHRETARAVPLHGASRPSTKMRRNARAAADGRNSALSVAHKASHMADARHTAAPSRSDGRLADRGRTLPPVPAQRSRRSQSQSARKIRGQLRGGYQGRRDDRPR
jgi:hypothetical protein